MEISHRMDHYNVVVSSQQTIAKTAY